MGGQVSVMFPLVSAHIDWQGIVGSRAKQAHDAMPRQFAGIHPQANDGAFPAAAEGVVAQYCCSV